MAAPSAPDRSARPLAWVFGVVLVFAFWTYSRSWYASILDRYEFRQLQTALSAYWMRHDGFHLDYLTPLFGPPWSIPMEFPTYQACVAGLSGLLHWPLEQTGRLVSILFFLATLPAVHELLGYAGLARSRRLLALTVVLSTPVYLFYTRTVMIETTALCFSVWFVYLLQRMLERNSWRLLPWVSAMAVLAALTKITTFVVYGVPAGLLALAHLAGLFRQSGPSGIRPALRTAVLAAIPVAVALAVGTVWVAHGDAIKDSNPYTGFLKSSELRLWNYGPLGLRFEASFWQHLGDNLTQNILAEGALAVILLSATWATPRVRWVSLACLAGFFSGPLIFANLYHVHDYYYSANALLLTGAAGLLLASAWDHPRLPDRARWVALGLVLLLQYRAFDRGYHYYYWKEAPPPPDLAAIMRETVPEEGVILIYGTDWNPLLPYYAQRRVVMIPGDRDDETAVLEAVLAKLPPRRIAALVTVGEKLRHRPDFLRERTGRFGLSPRPFASSTDADLYLPVSAISGAATRLQSHRFSTARILVTNRPTATDMPEQDLRSLSFPMTSPAPLFGRSRFGLSVGTAEGRSVINAHAPSEIHFQSPAGARHIQATVGLPAAAHLKPPPLGTDGIGVEVLLETPEGLRQSLYRRELDPSSRPGDRGPQDISLDFPEPLQGRLVFCIDPGPAGNITNDWAYWSRIDIR